MIFVENRRKSQKTLDKNYPNAEVIDVTSKGVSPFVELSPFYPHGNIPVPCTSGIFSYSVEGIWQGLKVFINQDVDVSKFEIRNMKNLKRSVRKFGQPLGHRMGLKGELLDYITARKVIYIPSYYWVLEYKTADILEDLLTRAKTNDLVLLDYETNEDIENVKKPISHAALIKHYLEERHPQLLLKRFTHPLKCKTKSKDSKKGKDNSENSEQLELGFK